MLAVPDSRLLEIAADAYIPALMLACLGLVVKPMLRGERRQAVSRLAFLGAGCALAFGLRWLDERYRFWPRAGMDYSTHTAVALVLALVLLVSVRRGRWLVMLTLPGYGLLMLSLGYHTVADMLSTTVAVLALYYPVIRYASRQTEKG